MTEEAPVVTGELDPSDPIVVLVTWFLTFVVGKIVKDRGKLDALRHVLPVIAVALAVGIRAGIDSAEGSPLTAQTVVRGIAEGAVAVMANSQVKHLFGKKKEEE